MLNDTWHEWSRGRRESTEIITLADYVALLKAVSKVAQNYDARLSFLDYLQRLERTGFIQEEGVLPFWEMDREGVDIR